MRRYCVCWGLLGFSLLLLFQITAYSQTNRISGMVFSPNNRPIPDLWIELMNEVNSVLARTRTDGSGRFSFSGVSSGRFSIRVNTGGTDYQEQTQEVEVINFNIGGRSSSDSVQKDIYLRPRKSTDQALINQTLFAQEIPKEAETFYRNALTNLDANRIDQGIAELKKAIAVFPTYFLALERLGVEYVKAKKFADAETVLESSVQIHPRSFQSWYGLAFAYSATGKIPESVAAAKKAVEISPTSGEALIILGVTLRSDKQFEDSAKAFSKALLMIKKPNPNIHWNLALLYYHNLKLYKKAADELESYLKLMPELPAEEIAKVKKLITQCRELAKN